MAAMAAADAAASKDDGHATCHEVTTNIIAAPLATTPAT